MDILKHRHEDIIRPSTVLNEAGIIIFNEHNHVLSEVIYNHLRGEKHVIYSSDDSTQISPVTMETIRILLLGK